jgi:hypothetical protein
MLDCTAMSVLFHTLLAKVEAFVIIGISFSVRSSQIFCFLKAALSLLFPLFDCLQICLRQDFT